MRDLMSAFVTLFVTIDPPGLAPLFLGLTTGMGRAERRQIATRASVTALAILVLFCVAGAPILTLFGVTLHSFRIAGGLLLFHIAFEMIFEKRQERHERSAERALSAARIRDIAIFPLAIPLIAGPGAISATILLAGSHPGVLDRAVLILIVAVNIVAAWGVFLLAERLDRFLGATVRTVLTRLLGVILAALAVQFVSDGIVAVLRAGS